MREKYRIIIAAFLFIAVAGVGCANQDPGSGTASGSQPNTTGPDGSASSVESALSEGDRYRDFTVPLADGSTFTLSEHEGRVILVNFWATWCGPCVGEMPAFTGLAKKYGDKLTLVAVNCQEDESTVQAFLEENNYTFPVGLDSDGAVSALYPSDGIPYTVIIAPDGTVAHIQVGAYDADEMYTLYRKEIDKLME